MDVKSLGGLRLFLTRRARKKNLKKRQHYTLPAVELKDCLVVQGCFSWGVQRLSLHVNCKRILIERKPCRCAASTLLFALRRREERTALTSLTYRKSVTFCDTVRRRRNALAVDEDVPVAHELAGSSPCGCYARAIEDGICPHIEKTVQRGPRVRARKTPPYPNLPVVGLKDGRGRGG